jgi:glycosyltransferase involved in cell wall biosynthesis
VACISEFGRQQAMRFSDEAHWHKLKVVRCGVNPGLYAAEPAPEHTGRDLLFVGRLEERKGVNFLLEAVALLNARGSNVRLKIVGSGPQKEALQRQTEALSLEAVVTFAGTKDEAGVAEALRHADLLVAPSLSEGLPVVIMEALASGVPVVASAVDGIPELVRDGETGCLVPPSDQQALADGVKQLLADPYLRQRMGDAGRQLVAKEYDALRNALELLGLIAPHARSGDDSLNWAPGTG